MDGKLEAVKYVPAKIVKAVVEKYKFSVDERAQEVINAASPDDVISIRLTINSPLSIIKAVNVTNNPDAIFEVAE